MNWGGKGQEEMDTRERDPKGRVGRIWCLCGGGKGRREASKPREPLRLGDRGMVVPQMEKGKWVWGR